MPINVKMRGIKIELAKNIQPIHLYRVLIELKDKEQKLYGRIHVPYVDLIENYIVGIVLSYRGSKKSLVAERNSQGELLVKKNELSSAENGIEVSIFCLNPETMKGLMYAYHGSITPNVFKALLNRAHNKARKSLRREQKEILTECGTKEIHKLKEKLDAHFEGELNLKILSTPGDLNTLLSQFSNIEEILVRSEEVLSDSGRFVPLEPFARTAAINIKINKEKSLTAKDLISAIKSALGFFDKDPNLERFQLIGIAHNGEEISRLVGENMDEFGSLDYDEFVEKLPATKWKNYKSSQATREIVDRVKRNTAIFGRPPTSSWSK